MGTANNITVLFGHDGGLHLIMREDHYAVPSAEPPACAGAATYRMVRRDGKVSVAGRQGSRTCHMEAAAIPQLPALLLNNQVLYCMEAPRSF